MGDNSKSAQKSNDWFVEGSFSCLNWQSTLRGHVPELGYPLSNRFQPRSNLPGLKILKKSVPEIKDRLLSVDERTPIGLRDPRCFQLKLVDKRPPWHREQGPRAADIFPLGRSGPALLNAFPAACL